MKLQGKFTMISVETRERDNKRYNNVNIETEDGQVIRLGVDEQVIPKMKKYQQYLGCFLIGTYNQNMYMRLIDVLPENR